MASTEAICDIPVNEFQPGVDNLDDWFDILENGIEILYGEDVTEEIRKTWLRLKLDAGTRKILRSCNQKAKWEDLKAELSSMMVTQQDKYNWRAGHNRVQWDGHESFHVLAVRVRQSVDTHMDNPREIDYYDNFRNALPSSYRSAIDLHSKKETLEEAKDVAFRFQVATSTLDGANQALGATGGSPASFRAASMSDDQLQDRLDTVEGALQNLSLELDILREEKNARYSHQNKRHNDHDDRRDRHGNRRGHFSDPDNRNDYHNSRFRQDDYHGQHNDHRKRQEERSDRYEDRRDRYVDRRNRYDDRFDRYDDRYDRDERFDSHDNTRQDSRHHYRNPRQDSGYDSRHDSRFDDRYDESQDRHHERQSYNYEDENRGNRYEECQDRRDNFHNRNDHRDEYDNHDDDDRVEQDRDADWYSRSVREERERRSGSRQDD